jgi:hypothetical protein
MPGKKEGVGYMGYDSANKMKDPAGYMKKDDAAAKMSHMEMSRELTYGGPVIDQMGNALSRMGAMKVLKHSKSRM